MNVFQNKYPTPPTFPNEFICKGVYRKYVMKLRQIELQDIYVQITETDHAGKLIHILKSFDDIEYLESKSHILFGKLKLYVVSFIDFWNFQIDAVNIAMDKHRHLSAKYEVIQILQETVEMQKIKQDEFRGNYLPVYNDEEADMYDNIEIEYEKYITQLEETVEYRIQNLKYDNPDLTKKYIDELVTATQMKTCQIFNFTQDYIIEILVKCIPYIRNSLMDIHNRMANNLLEATANKDDFVKDLWQRLYEKNKEVSKVMRQAKKSSCTMAELKEGIDRIRDKFDNLDKLQLVRRLQEEVKYWQSKLEELEGIMRLMTKLDQYEEYVYKQERIHRAVEAGKKRGGKRGGRGRGRKRRDGERGKRDGGHDSGRGKERGSGHDAGTGSRYEAGGGRRQNADHGGGHNDGHGARRRDGHRTVRGDKRAGLRCTGCCCARSQGYTNRGKSGRDGGPGKTKETKTKNSTHPGERRPCFEALGKKIEQRKWDIKKYKQEAKNMLITYLVVRGNNHMYFHDKFGKFYVDPYEHNTYIVDRCSDRFHFDCEGNLKPIKDSEIYYFDEHGRHLRTPSGKRLYKRSNCSSEYILAPNGQLVKTSADCGHSFTVRKNCKLEPPNPTDTVILPEAEPINIDNTLNPDTVKYLWDTFGSVLPETLNQVGIYQPRNPIHYFAQRLIRNRYAMTNDELRVKDEEAHKYRDDVMNERQEKVKAAMRLWKSKQMKRVKPEETVDGLDWMAYNAYTAEHTFIDQICTLLY